MPVVALIFLLGADEKQREENMKKRKPLLLGVWWITDVLIR
jgi:hypothetical protein